MTTIGLAVILVVLAAAICACLEAAFFSVSISRAKLYKEQGKRGGAALLSIKEHLHDTIIALVILNNGVTIVGSIYVGHLATEHYGNQIIGLISAILTASIIIFGEIVPKMLGENYSRAIALMFAPLTLVLTKIFMPVTYLVEFLTKSFMKVRKVTSEEELQMLTRMGEAEGTIGHGERVLIQRVFTLNDMTARDIMTPRTVIESLPADVPLREVSVILTHKPYSRYPVFEHSVDRIVGTVQTSRLLTALAKGNDGELVSHFMSAPVFVPETKRVDDLMGFFLSTRNHMAIVQDQFGATTGVVTFEDVLEQLVGEIVDETDEVVDLRKLAHDKHNSRTV